MKKMLSVFLSMAMAFSLAACGTNENSVVDSSEQTSSAAEQEIATVESPEMESGGETNETDRGNNILVAYFSRADNAILADDVDAVASPSVIPPGNVQQLAGWVQEETGGTASSWLCLLFWNKTIFPVSRYTFSVLTVLVDLPTA